MNLHFTKLGNGEPILIVHGLFGSSDNWRTLGKKFSENNTVYLIDLRNHGRSAHSDEMNYEIMAEDLMNLIIKENIILPTLLGHSMGGKAALMFVKKFPDIIGKLIVADIGIKSYPMHHELILEGLNSIDLNKINSRSEAQKKIAVHIEEVGVQQFLLKNLYWIEKGQLAWRMNLNIIEKNIQEILKRINLEKNYTKTLFLRGGLSNYILLEDFEEIQSKFPNGKIKTIENVGHWLHAENPLEFYRLVMNFIKE
jgi:pimeloyl-ACP methyl ester carboxylesterase|tara:strand:- start:2722 stop:3483 length:762 start_codon:yes stop_codon:yes gene_type:complete